MDVVTAMVISTVVAIICELIRYRNLKCSRPSSFSLKAWERFS